MPKMESPKKITDGAGGWIGWTEPPHPTSRSSRARMVIFIFAQSKPELLENGDENSGKCSGWD
jgi:hypothetical protein